MSAGCRPNSEAHEQHCSFRALVEALPDLVCQYRPDATLVYVNRAYAAFHGLDPAELIGRRFTDLIADDLRPSVGSNLDRLVAEAHARPRSVNEHLSRDATGRNRWVQWTDQAVFADTGELEGFVAVGRDVTERRFAEDRITHLAEHDPLTGLANRRRAVVHLGRALTAVPPVPEVGVLFIDLDGFKLVNDTQGHQAGDRLLQAVAAALRSAVRQHDLVGRLGGDEFLVVCTQLDVAASLGAMTDRIRARLAALQPSVEASVGAVLAQPGDQVADVLHRADRAMYRDKSRAGTDRHGASARAAGAQFDATCH
ncbi:MAG: GGDEF domain-containing protein [Acidimicrobiales bacterium]|nr:GGDEF domain-containing protein [Acidimicrobiales bacterium]